MLQTLPDILPIPTGDSIALYVHWPFCVSKCPYCDFNSHVRDIVDSDAWQRALLTDLGHEAELTGRRPLSSIFFGGGTPSLMPPTIVAAIIDAAAQYWQLADDIEITLEANPNSAEAARFADLARAGVNRVSLGLQALKDDALRFLGRAHDVAEGLAALATAQRHFERVSFDLIYALPGQSEAEWDAELAQALGLGTGHLSLYQLTIEPGTRFASMAARGELAATDPDHAATLYELTQARTAAAGIPAYEISNHARTGEQSRHNLTYWRYGDYIGIGPGAHGRRGACATQRHRKPENWMDAVTRNGHGLQSEEPLPGEDRAREALLMGLRLREGIDLKALAMRTGLAMDQLLLADGVSRMAGLGFVEHSGDRLRILPAGMLLLDAILPEIVRV